MALGSELDWIIPPRGPVCDFEFEYEGPLVGEPGHKVIYDYQIEHDDRVDEERRKERKFLAEFFRNHYAFSSTLEPITCISSHGTRSLSDRSSGISWVGVHGIDSLCVVTMVGDLDFKRMCGRLAWHYSYELAFHCFRRSIISYMEDLADPSANTLHQTCSLRIEKPFGVVSASTLIPDPTEVHKDIAFKPPSNEWVKKFWMAVMYGSENEGTAWPTFCDKIKKKATDAKPDEQKAIKFLQEKVESGSAFTVDETIQTAISGFQHLFQKKFKADEIEVAVVDPNYGVFPWEADVKDYLVKELNTSEIEYHLAAVNNLGSRGGSGSGSRGGSGCGSRGGSGCVSRVGSRSGSSWIDELLSA